MPTTKMMKARMTRDADRMAVGKRPTSPVCRYSVMTGIEMPRATSTIIAEIVE